MYATKRRRRNVKTYKHTPKENQKSNPSKRHRERLNAELENLANLLPFEQTILTKLDKLSILRLAVSYLRIKSYFQVKLKISNYLSLSSTQQQEHERNRYPQLYYMDPSFSEGNAILDSLNGFILIANSNSEVFYASRTVEQFLGFHQSDIIHQSIYELIHSEDREEFKRQLNWNLKLTNEKSDITLNDLLTKKEYSKYLDRNFTVRFRCLLDNTSGFVTLDIIGRLGVLYGQRNAIDTNDNHNHTTNGKQTHYKTKNMKILNNNNNASQNHLINNEIDNEPILALFAVAVPFGPPSLFELPQRDSLFRTKHKVNLAPLTIDPRGKLILGYNEQEFTQFSGYDLIHIDDLKYYCNAHKELLKTGSSGLVCYRILNKEQNWQWIQSSMRIIYKSNKPECVIANHRPLTSEEGEELYYKRGLEFKLPYPCLYDFEANFNSIVTNYSSNSTNDDSNIFSLSSQTKPIPTNNRLNNSTNNQNNTNKLPNSLNNSTTVNPTVSSSTTSSTKSSSLTTTKSKANKHTKASTNRLQNQKSSSLCRSDQQALLNPADSNYFNGLAKIDNLTNNYSLFETPTSGAGLPIAITNDYQTFGENPHHYNYTSYFNGLNGYNYANYATQYSIYTNPHASQSSLHNTTQQLNNSQNNLNELAFNTNQSTASSWFEAANQTKLGQNAYSLINYTNQTHAPTATTTTATAMQAYNYNDLFNCTSAAAKYAAAAVVSNSNVDTFDKTSSSSSYYLDDYAHSGVHQLGSNSLYDYNKYNQSISKASLLSTTSTVNDNQNNNFNNMSLKKEQNFQLANGLNTSTSPSSQKVSSSSSSVSCSSSSSSTSPSIPITNQTSLLSNTTQDHNNNTNNLFSTNNDLKYKNKYENYELKVQSNVNMQDRNSLQSFSTSSSCSSSSCTSSSLSTNYSDETAVKSFIKQENCMIELAVGLNNSNNIRNGFLKDYYCDFYQNNVNI